MTYAEFYAHFMQTVPGKGQRRGQTLYNTLYNVRQDLADRLERRGVDPYYDDSKVVPCLDWLSEEWNK